MSAEGSPPRAAARLKICTFPSGARETTAWLDERREGIGHCMSQFEQENDLGRGGGEVDDETMDDAKERAGLDDERDDEDDGAEA